MEATVLEELIRRGEDSTLQFKAQFDSVDQLAAELWHSRTPKVVPYL